jgi:hypothetical protein
MMADTAVIAKPSNSKAISSNLYLKVPTGGWVIVFFDFFRGERTRGLRSGFASGLTPVGLRGVKGLFIFSSTL